MQIVTVIIRRAHIAGIGTHSLAVLSHIICMPLSQCRVRRPSYVKTATQRAAAFFFFLISKHKGEPGGCRRCHIAQHRKTRFRPYSLACMCLCNCTKTTQITTTITEIHGADAKRTLPVGLSVCLSVVLARPSHSVCVYAWVCTCVYIHIVYMRVYEFLFFWM